MDQSIIGNGILALEDSYDNDAEFRASFDSVQKIFSLECFAKDSPEMESFYESVFWNGPNCFPLEDSWTYRFRMTTYKDIGTAVEKAVFIVYIETKVGLMPIKGRASADDWKKFTDQLIYTVNGEKYILQAPDFLLF